MTALTNFLLPLLVFLSTAGGNQYQQFYQQHFKNPHKQQHQYVHPPPPSQQPAPHQPSTPSQQSQAHQPLSQQSLSQQSLLQSQSLSPPQPLSQPQPLLDQQPQQYLVQPWSPSMANSPQTAIYPAGIYPNNNNPHKPPVYSSAQWGSSVHNTAHQHGAHVHGAHQHHPAHGARVRPEDDDVFRRPYCELRTGAGGQCCPGRQDSCYVPILDTVCYCDVFCNRTVADCCPDFWTWCMGIAPPDGAMGHGHLPVNQKKAIVNNCKYKSQYYGPDTSIQINCNNCSCVEASMGTEYNWQCSQKICLLRNELIDHVSKGNFGWHTTNYTYFWGMTLDEGVSHRLGTKRPMKTVKQMASMHVNINDVLPETFDGREEWGDLLHPVQDQGNCGASWVFSTTSVAADRFSIHSGGAVRDLPSPQHLLSCNKDHMQHGCDGGHLDRAWWFLRKSGVVDVSCYPYRSGTTSEAGTCLVPAYKTTGPRVKCPTKELRTSLVYQVAPPYRIAPSEREIMKEILENGPVQATLEVKEDFFMYKGGVYRYSLPANILPPNHRTTGFHSVRVLGWGIDRSSGKPLKYWLCANSWGRKWGEDGFFRIVRGQDECKIESFVVGVLGKLNGRPIVKARSSKSSQGFAKKQRPFSNKKRS